MQTLPSKNYKDFFLLIDQFKEKQLRQKQRGLNNYNILTAVLKPTDEVRLHSGMIYSLLKIDGDHYQSYLFLEIFLKTLKADQFFINIDKCNVYKEFNNIDIYITDGHKHIIIENKVSAPDQKEQIKRYINRIKKENENITHDDILLVYLSINKKDPSKYSLAELEINDNHITKDNIKIARYKAISYKNEIIDWLKECKFEVQNIINLSEAIRQYIDVIYMINNQYKEKTMTLASFIRSNSSIYQTALEIQKIMPEVRKNIIDEFFSKIVEILKSKIDSDWEVEIEDSFSKKHTFPLKIYKNSWGDKNLIFSFDFDKNDYQNGYFCVVCINGKINAEHDIPEDFTEELENLEIELNTSEKWFHWEYIPKLSNTSDFPEYVISNNNSEEEITDAILNIIRIFEIDSNLLTRINQNLNESSALKT